MEEVTTQERVDIVAKVRALREKLHMSQPQMANELGIPFRTFQDWENGMRIPTIPAVRLLERYLAEKGKKK